MMTKTLQKAFEEASKLPELEQDKIAAWLLEELQSEQRWAHLYEGSGKQMEQLADETLAEHLENRTKYLDIATR